MPGEFRSFEPYFPEQDAGYEAKNEEEKRFEAAIRECTSIDKVRELVLKRGVIPSASTEGGFLSSEEVVRRIDQVRNGHREIGQGRITRTFGIRETVDILLLSDKTYMKRARERERKEKRKAED